MTVALSPVEQAFVAYLENGSGFRTSTRVLNPRPAQFVRVTRTGGSSPVGLVVGRPTLLVECWGGAGNDASAWAVAAAVWPLCNVPHPVQVSASAWASRIEATEPVNFPDSLSGCSRYQFIVTPTVRLLEVSP